jgi:hypothetical protein
VLYDVLSLALALSPLPAASVTPGAAIAVCFAPEEDCTAFAVDAIDAAEREILISAYSLTADLGHPRGSGPRSAAWYRRPPHRRQDHALRAQKRN